jgi:hypothetical protein
LFDKYCPGIKSGIYLEDGSLDILRKLTRQMWAELFGIVVTIRNQATFQTGQCHHFFFAQYPLSSGPRIPQAIPLIVHSPSNRLIKRTDVVLEAIEILKKEGHEFRFSLLEGLPNSEVVGILKSADIVVDQPATWPARLAIEGCASGCCVISGNHHEFVARPANPTLQFEADPAALASTIRHMLLDREELTERMRMCWEFWRDNYSPEVFHLGLCELLEGRGTTFGPLPDQKSLVLSRCNSGLERFLVRALYHPRASGRSQSH